MNCTKCSAEFSIREEDQKFYTKISVPSPTLCPDCRLQRRLSFRNERSLYKRPCNLCHKSFLAIYDENVPFPVYCYDCWWSDKWDVRDYGVEYKTGELFSAQIEKLFQKVPHLGIVTAHCENCDYANFTNYSRNSYLVFGCYAVEDCAYNWRSHNSVQCLECVQIDRCEYCFECIDCTDSYNLFFSQDCSNCSDSAFLYDCKSSKNCLFSSGLRNAEYYIFNKKLSPQDFEQEKAKLNLNSSNSLEKLLQKFSDFVGTVYKKNTFVLNSERVVGDHIINSKNIHQGFHLMHLEDSAYVDYCEDLKDSWDCTFSGWPAELCYESISAGVNCYNTKFSSTCWSCVNSEYCESCHHSSDLFGCFGFRSKGQYCILNRQYSKEDYTNLRYSIIEEMKKTGEYGEFFRYSISPFAYNETIANEFFPLTKEEALRVGFKWKDINQKEYQPATLQLPDNLKETSDTVIKEILVCESCEKNYRIIDSELKFYRKFNIALPRKCFDCRHKARMSKIPSRKLKEVTCKSCAKTMLTTHEKTEKLLCEDCYLKLTY